MWSNTYSKFVTGVSKQAIWKIWSDIENWPEWHDDLDYCKLEGSFKPGSHFTLKPKGMREVNITLLSVQVEREFTDRTHFFGAKMYDTHTMVETNGGLLLTNKLIVTGPLTWLWVKLVANNVAKSVPSEIESLITVAKKHGK